MIIGERLQAIREQKNLSQGDIEKRSGLFRSYISRVENGHTVPSIATLEKLARALEVPLYQIFYEGKGRPGSPAYLKHGESAEANWGSSGKDEHALANMGRLLGKMKERYRHQLLYMAQQMAKRYASKRGRANKGMTARSKT